MSLPTDFMKQIPQNILSNMSLLKKTYQYTFYENNPQLINRSLEIIKQNPVKGFDVVTVKTLYQLIYSGLLY